MDGSGASTTCPPTPGGGTRRGRPDRRAAHDPAHGSGDQAVGFAANPRQFPFAEDPYGFDHDDSRSCRSSGVHPGHAAPRGQRPSAASPTIRLTRSAPAISWSGAGSRRLTTPTRAWRHSRSGTTTGARSRAATTRPASSSAGFSWTVGGTRPSTSPEPRGRNRRPRRGQDQRLPARRRSRHAHRFPGEPVDQRAGHQQPWPDRGRLCRRPENGPWLCARPERRVHHDRRAGRHADFPPRHQRPRPRGWHVQGCQPGRSRLAVQGRGDHHDRSPARVLRPGPRTSTTGARSLASTSAARRTARSTSAAAWRVRASRSGGRCGDRTGSDDVVAPVAEGAADRGRAPRCR
jgi:hypothetical protein